MQIEVIIGIAMTVMNFISRYFMGTFWNGTVADPSEKHLYSVSEDGSKLAHCITCELKNSDGELCRSNDVKISANFTYFIHSCNGPGIPETTTRYLNKVKQVMSPVVICHLSYLHSPI